MIRRPYVAFRELGMLNPDGRMEKSFSGTEYDIDSLQCFFNETEGRFNLKSILSGIVLPYSLLLHLIVYGMPSVYTDTSVFTVERMCEGVKVESSLKPRFDIFRDEINDGRKSGQNLKEATIDAKVFLGAPDTELEIAT